MNCVSCAFDFIRSIESQSELQRDDQELSNTQMESALALQLAPRPQMQVLKQISPSHDVVGKTEQSAEEFPKDSTEDIVKEHPKYTQSNLTSITTNRSSAQNTGNNITGVVGTLHKLMIL